jgi:hypothetical protein
MSCTARAGQAAASCQRSLAQIDQNRAARGHGAVHATGAPGVEGLLFSKQTGRGQGQARQRQAPEPDHSLRPCPPPTSNHAPRLLPPPRRLASHHIIIADYYAPPHAHAKTVRSPLSTTSTTRYTPLHSTLLRAR